MITSSFGFDHPVLREPLRRSPQMRLEWTRSDVIEGRTHVFVWAAGGDFETFEVALAEDPTITAVQSNRDDERRLFRFILANQGETDNPYPLLVEEGGVVRRLTATREGWECTVTLPDFGGTHRLFSFFADHDLGFSVHRMVKDGVDSREQEEHGRTVRPGV